MSATVAAQPKSGAAAPAPSILSPVIDFLCVGGLSLVVLVPLLVSGQAELGFVTIAALVWIQTLINTAHFMASYRIVYRDRAMIMKHRWAAIGVPAIMLAFIALALATESTVLVVLFFAVSSGYLAWHYTGQAWGMMASYGRLGGLSFDKSERLLIRSSLRIMLVWHVTWFLHYAIKNPAVLEPVDAVYTVVSGATIIAFALGLVGLVKAWRRTGKVPPARALVPWFAIFAWYAAVARWGIAGLFLVQLAHAIQYLEFPARVELNRTSANKAARLGSHMLLYAAALLALSFAVTLIVPGPAMSVVTDTLGIARGSAAPVLILYFINIHHYFTDGVIWKISNPEVRRDLFAHVMPAEVPSGARGKQAVSGERTAKLKAGKTRPSAKR
jgi:hypothetical protein